MTSGVRAGSAAAACRYGTYLSADPMIAVCDDQRPIRVRAASGYSGGAVPVLSRPDQPQYPGPAVPVRHERRRVGGHRADAAGPGVEAGQGRAASGMVPPRHRGRDPLPGERGHPVAGDAGRFPAHQTVYDLLDAWQESGRPRRCTAICAPSAASRPGAGRSRRGGDHRSSSRPPRPSAGPAAATTRERRSTAASGTSPSTPSGCC